MPIAGSQAHDGSMRLPALSNRLSRQVASFVKVGLVATSVHYAALMTMVQVAGASPVPSALLGYCLGGIVSYRLNRRHTFESERRHSEAAWRFALVAGIGFLITFALMALFVERWNVPYMFAQIVTTGIVMFGSFTANRAWTFAKVDLLG